MNQQFFVGYNGVNLAADAGGDSSWPGVILLHGGGQTRGSWGVAARTLVARGYRVVSLDLRGHGQSDWAPDGDYSVDAHIADLKAVLRTFTAPPALVGASLGGVTALLTVAESALPLAAALVLVDVVPKLDLEGAARIAAFMSAHPHGFATLEEAADAVAAYLPHRPRPKDNSGLRRNLRIGADQRLYWHWDPRIVSDDQPRHVRALRSRMDACARHVTIPTLLVRGEHSDVVTLEGAADLLAAIPGAAFVDVAGARHMVAGDENDAFCSAIFDFLERRIPRADASSSA